MTKKINYIFWGTPQFGATILEGLIENGYAPQAIVTSPDKPKGRKKLLSPSPVKKIGIKYKLDVLQPISLKGNQSFKEQINRFKPSLFLVASYGQILTEEILKIPPYGSLNVHPSLLPKYRGPSPIQATILAGDKETGTSVILMDKKIDHGPIIGKIKLKIQNPRINYQELSEELAKLGIKMLIKILPQWIEGKIKPYPQDHSRATFTKIIKKKDGEINWQKSACFIERMTRAYSLWPVPYTKWQNKILKIIEAESKSFNTHLEPGKVFLNKNNELCVSCAKGFLILKKVQLEGGKILEASDFLHGHSQIVGQKLN